MKILSSLLLIAAIMVATVTIIALQIGLELSQSTGQVATEKTIKYYQGALHDLLHERVKEEVMSDICQWLEARMASLH